MRFIYLDEAGTSANDKHTVVAGIVVHGDEQLIPLENHLDELAIRFIPAEDREDFVFHLTEIWSGTGYFRNREKWPLRTRISIMRALADVPNELSLPVVFGFVSREETINRHPQIKDNASSIDLFGHSVAFSGCSMVAERFMREVYPDEVAQIVAEDDDRARKMVKEVHAIYRNPGEITRRGIKDEMLPFERIRNSILFAQKSESKPLQIADMCAFFLRGFFRDQPHTSEYYNRLKPWLTVLRRCDINKVEHTQPLKTAYPFGPVILG